MFFCCIRVLSTSILATVNTILRCYCTDFSYPRGCLNQMWIQTNSNDLLKYIRSSSLSIYTTITHSNLRDRLKEGRVFQQSQYSYGYQLSCSRRLMLSSETGFMKGLLEKNDKKLSRSFNFTFRYIDDVLSLNNFRFGDFLDRMHLSY